jgi:hypothetical protein
MDKAKVLEVFGEKAAKQIKLLDVDSTALLLNVLDQIQNACGTQWQTATLLPDTGDKDKDGNKTELTILDKPYDCTKGNDLGKTFGPDWETTPEFAMVRLLSMTPSTANVSGTSLQRAADYIAQNPILPFTLRGLLADSLGIGLNDPFIPKEQLAQALKDTLMSSHPNLGNDEGKLPITLYDAVMDMQPLATTFGPVCAQPECDGPDDHPGILVPDDENFTTQSDALTPAFRMLAVADSNLRYVDGVDVSVGGGSMFVSTKADPLSFDFEDEEKVQMLGIAEMPTVDMRMSISELPTTVASCASTDECKTNLPDAPVGTDHVWSAARWSLERIVGAAGYLTYGQREYEECLIIDEPSCDAGVWIGPNKIQYPPPNSPGPIGWTQFKVLDKQVPPPQFLWEMFLEIAQVAVHDPVGDNNYNQNINKANDIPEGEVKPVLALKGVPIGLTADEMIAQIRPELQKQAGFIANVILGRYWVNNSRLDFYYRRANADGGAPLVFFVAPSDPRPDAADPNKLADYTYEKPGFFRDEKLTDKASTTTMDGVEDTEHEKLRLDPGETELYMQDDEGDVYRLRFFVPEGDDPTEIVVHVHKQ